MLSRVGVIISRINVQVGKQPPTEPVLGQHSFHGMFDNALGVLVKHLAGRGKALTAGVTRVADVNLVGHFLAGEANLVGIDDDHVVSAVNVRGEVGFVFTPDHGGNLAGQTTQNLVFSIHNNPLLRHRVAVGGDGFVA